MARAPHVNRARPGEAVATFARLLTIDTDECVLWPHARNSKGYGQLGVNGVSRSVRPRPDGKEVAHRCGVKRCVNGRHVRWATRSENEADKWAHGTQWRRGRNTGPGYFRVIEYAHRSAA